MSFPARAKALSWEFGDDPVTMRHGVMMDLPFNPAAYIMQPAYPPKSHAAVLFSSQPPAQAPAPLCISEQQRLLHKRSLRAEAQMRRREKLKQRKMPSPEVVEQPAALQNSSPQPCSAEEQRLLHKRSLRAAAQMRWRERGKARKVLAALSERLVRAMPTKFQFHIQKEWVRTFFPHANAFRLGCPSKLFPFQKQPDASAWAV